MRKSHLLEQDILMLTIKIKEEFPELSKYLVETPISFIRSLSGNMILDHEDYYESLIELLRRYSVTHFNMNNESKFIKVANREYSIKGLNCFKTGENKSKEEPIKTPRSSIGKDINDVKAIQGLHVSGFVSANLNESIKSGYEENDFYSLGGDNHFG